MSNVDFSGQLMATMEEKVLGHLSCLLLDFFVFLADGVASVWFCKGDVGFEEYVPFL